MIPRPAPDAVTVHVDTSAMESIASLANPARSRLVSGTCALNWV